LLYAHVSLFHLGLAVFMPCFMSQSPAGVQIYLATSFVFTLGQSYALRSDSFRKLVGLPLRGDAAKAEAIYAKEFIELKRLEQKAREAWGDQEPQGKGIMANGLMVAFPGRNLPSTIKGSGFTDEQKKEANRAMLKREPTRMTVSPQEPIGNAPFIHGISAPPQQLELEQQQKKSEEIEQPAAIMEEPTEDEIELANRGELPIKLVKPEKDKAIKPLSVKRFKNKKTKRRR
jgi:hypothetical protein